jgi:hypothetical protein
MTLAEIKIEVNIRVGDALIELQKDNPDLCLVRDKLCDAAQFTYFEDGIPTDTITPELANKLCSTWVKANYIIQEVQHDKTDD